MNSPNNLEKANEFITFVAKQTDIYNNFSFYVSNKINKHDDLLKDVYQDTIISVYESIIKGIEIRDYLAYFYRSLRNNYLKAKKTASKTIYLDDISQEFEGFLTPNDNIDCNFHKEITEKDILDIKHWAKSHLTKDEWLFFNEYYFINHQKKSYKQIAFEHNIKHREYVWQLVSSAKSKIKDHFGNDYLKFNHS